MKYQINSEEQFYQEVEKLPINKLILFPKDWFDFIPVGFMVTDIHGEAYPFSKEESRDHRSGILSFGIIKPLKTNQHERTIDRSY